MTKSCKQSYITNGHITMYTKLLFVYIQYLSNQTLTVLKYLNSYCEDRAKLPVKLDPLTLLVLNLYSMRKSFTGEKYSQMDLIYFNGTEFKPFKFFTVTIFYQHDPIHQTFTHHICCFANQLVTISLINSMITKAFGFVPMYQC